jgi:hypothetical protein
MLDSFFKLFSFETSLINYHDFCKIKSDIKHAVHNNNNINTISPIFNNLYDQFYIFPCYIVNYPVFDSIIISKFSNDSYSCSTDINFTDDIDHLDDLSNNISDIISNFFDYPIIFDLLNKIRILLLTLEPYHSISDNNFIKPPSIFNKISSLFLSKHKNSYTRLD